MTTKTRPRQKKFSDVGKKALYGVWTNNFERRARLNEDATRKALDLPLEEDVNITTTNNVSGMTWKHLLAGTVGLSGLGAIGILSGLLLRSPAPAKQPPPAVEPVTQNLRLKVRFWDQHDKPFDYIPHRIDKEGKSDD